MIQAKRRDNFLRLSFVRGGKDDGFAKARRPHEAEGVKRHFG
jgi:hypothetical protein